MQRLTSIIRGREAEIRLAIRVTIAACIAYALAKLSGLPQGYWAVITAILVMQTSVGASLKAALDRFGGTLAGAAYGALVSILMPHGSAIALAAAVAVATLPMALLAAIKSNFKVAPVTALIVLLPTPGNTAPPMLYALDRILEIGLGNIVGIAVALAVLPARAHTLLVSAGARVARLNADLLKALIEGLTATDGRSGVAAIHARIRAALKQMEAAADEASRERKSHLSDLPDPEPLVRTLYRVRHDLVMIGRATAKPLPKALENQLLSRLVDLRDAAAGLLGRLADAIGSGQPSPSTEELDIALRAYAAAMDALPKDAAASTPPDDDLSRIFTLRFAFEQLNQDLRDLARRTDEMARKSTI